MVKINININFAADAQTRHWFVFYVSKGVLHIVASEAFLKKEYSMDVHGTTLVKKNSEDNWTKLKKTVIHCR